MSKREPDSHACHSPRTPPPHAYIARPFPHFMLHFLVLSCRHGEGLQRWASSWCDKEAICRGITVQTSFTRNECAGASTGVACWNL